MNSEGDAAVEDAEEQEDTEEQDEEKMKTCDEVEEDDRTFTALHHSCLVKADQVSAHFLSISCRAQLDKK